MSVRPFAALALLAAGLLAGCGEGDEPARSGSAAPSRPQTQQQAAPATTQVAQNQPQASRPASNSDDNQKYLVETTVGDFLVEVVYQRIEPKLQLDATTVVPASEGVFFAVILKVTGVSGKNNAYPTISRTDFILKQSSRPFTPYQMAHAHSGQFERNWYPGRDVTKMFDIKPGNTVEIPLLFDVRYVSEGYTLYIMKDRQSIPFYEIPKGNGTLPRDVPIKR